MFKTFVTLLSGHASYYHPVSVHVFEGKYSLQIFQAYYRMYLIM